MQNVSIADLRRALPGLLRSVEKGHSLKVTRRGRPIAVVLSLEDYEKLTAKPTIAEAHRQWWETSERWDDDPWADVRDPSPGRDVEL